MNSPSYFLTALNKWDDNYVASSSSTFLFHLVDETLLPRILATIAGFSILNMAYGFDDANVYLNASLSKFS